MSSWLNEHWRVSSRRPDPVVLDRFDHEALDRAKRLAPLWTERVEQQKLIDDANHTITVDTRHGSPSKFQKERQQILRAKARLEKLDPHIDAIRQESETSEQERDDYLKDFIEDFE